ncbi:hypothetical protein [uncultured Arcobacter sp.]|uniref:DUF7831 domain-containing protein n=1 Tax=uncultured Arcobacter sp. TaxID=165434 RepID=UPI00262E2EAC|nr:hypothetical protein [uncultured Arcobacter sp.]
MILQPKPNSMNEHIGRIFVTDRYSVELCRNHPDKIFVFGDNLQKTGRGGQAIIRDCKNTFGIPTKVKPAMTESSFFSDKPYECIAVEEELVKLNKLYNMGRNLVFPIDGIGTGLAKLKEKSPMIYNLIKEYFEEKFNLNIM